MDYQHDCPHIAPSLGSCQMVADPELIYLREDLADEFSAINDYLECASLSDDRYISHLFRKIAEEEAGHFIQLFRMVSSLDPVQADELAKHDLEMLLFSRMPSPPNFVNNNAKENSKDSSYHAKKKHYDKYPPVLKCLKNAIRDELSAINNYQKQIQMINNPTIQNLLIPIMNKEKEHVAEFTKAFYDLIHKQHKH